MVNVCKQFCFFLNVLTFIVFAITATLQENQNEGDNSCEAIFQIPGTSTRNGQTVCVESSTCTSCCSYNNTCHASGICCPNGYESCGNGQCCQTGSTFCGDRCCKSGYDCLNNGCGRNNFVICGNGYCNAGYYCCGVYCCPNEAFYCNDGYYCNSGGHCCGSAGSGGYCCPESTNCCFDGCCASGWYCGCCNHCFPGTKAASEYGIIESELDDIPVLLRGRYVETKYSSILKSKYGLQKPGSVYPSNGYPKSLATQPLNPTAQSDCMQPSQINKCLLASNTWLDPCFGFPCFIENTDCRDEMGYLEFFGLSILCNNTAAVSLDSGGKLWWTCSSECVTSSIKNTMLGNAIPCCNSLDAYGLNTTNVNCMLDRCNFCLIYKSNLYILQQIFQSSVQNPYYIQIRDFIAFCENSH